MLHDGSAATILEAVVRHAGEAQAARDGLLGLSAADLAALMSFLESL